jgi:hypothetical protein
MILKGVKGFTIGAFVAFVAFVALVALAMDDTGKMQVGRDQVSQTDVR